MALTDRHGMKLKNKKNVWMIYIIEEKQKRIITFKDEYTDFTN